jgi:two-component sensor histidine kinase
VALYHSPVLPALLLSTSSFILLPSFLALYIQKSKHLLYKYYSANIQKDREINHRIKNQLAILKSIINLKTNTNKGENDNIVMELQSIIDSFILVYDKLLYSENIHSINLYNYLSGLFEEYDKSLPLNIIFHQKNKEILIPSEESVQLGICFAELITNSLKHTSTKNLKINIQISTDTTNLIFQYYDSGSETKDYNSIQSSGFGKSIINMIIETKFEGEIEEDYSNGYCLTAKIPLHLIVDSKKQ